MYTKRDKKIKIIFSILIMLTMTSAYSVSDFECATEIPTTSTKIKSMQDKITLNYTHHNGTSLAPIHNGLITANDIQHIVQKGQLIAKMGDNIKLSFDKKNCRVHDQGNYHCFSNKEATIGSLTVTSYGFFTHQTKSILFGTDFTEFNFRLYVRTTEGISLESEMIYDLSSNDCRFDKF